MRTADLSRVGGPANGQVIGGVVQELALPSGRVLFEWRSLDHVGVEETHAIYTGHPLDYFHVNSIDLTIDGSLLVSARNTWGVYKVSRKTGEVLWRLGGRRSDFEMGKGTVFAWQHDARHHGDGLISIFDDGAAPQVEPQSRVLVIRLDGKRAGRRWCGSTPIIRAGSSSKFMGNAQVLGNGNVVVGWGSEPFVTEFAPDGSIVLDAEAAARRPELPCVPLPLGRRPSTRPALVYRSARDGRKLFVSWNGATEVAAWQLLAGPTARGAQPRPPRRRSRGSRRHSPRRTGCASPLRSHSTGTATSSVGRRRFASDVSIDAMPGCRCRDRRACGRARARRAGRRRRGA